MHRLTFRYSAPFLMRFVSLWSLNATGDKKGQSLANTPTVETGGKLVFLTSLTRGHP